MVLSTRDLTVMLMAAVTAALVGGVAGHFQAGWLPLALLTAVVAVVSAYVAKVPVNALLTRIRGIISEAAAGSNAPDGELEPLIKETLQGLRRKVAMLEALRDGITTPFFIVDGNSKLVIHMNKAMAQLTGNTPKEALNKMKGFQLLNYPDMASCEVCRPVSSIVIPQKTSWTGEVVLRSKAGNELTVLVHAFPILGDDGEVAQVPILLNDISEIRCGEQQINENYQTILRTTDAMAGNVDRLGDATHSLTGAVEQARYGAQRQQQSLDDASDSMRNLDEAINEVAGIAENASENAQSAKEFADSGQRIVDQVVEAIDLVHSRSNSVRDKLLSLDKQADDIGQVMNVISDIADQTNLLALNAAIEAARAGEAGRGFAVVADEVRKLAEKTMQATRQVGDVVSSIQAGSRTNVEEMDRAVEAVTRTTDLADKAGDALQKIVDIVDTTSDQVRLIAGSSKNQAESSDRVRQNMEEIASISHQTHEGMELSQSLATDIETLSREQLDLIQEMNRKE